MHVLQLDLSIITLKSFCLLLSGSGSVFDIGSHHRQQPSWKARLALGLESLKVTAFVTFATFLALFMDDFRLACLPTSLDNPCQYISLGVMVSPLFLFSLSQVRTGFGKNHRLLLAKCLPVITDQDNMIRSLFSWSFQTEHIGQKGMCMRRSASLNVHSHSNHRSN